MTRTDQRKVAIIGISRGIGRGLATEYLHRGWSVVGTARHALSDADTAAIGGGSAPLQVERLDLSRPEEIAALHEHLTGERFDVLLVVAGVSDGDVPVAQMEVEAFNEVMDINALAPLKVVEALQDLVADDGTIAVMSSNQGSITLNDQGGFEVYRASKTALNQLMRSYAVRHRDDARALLLVTPGWVQTNLGGPNAPMTVEQSASAVIDVIEARRHARGLHYVDHRNETVPW